MSATYTMTSGQLNIVLSIVQSKQNFVLGAASENARSDETSLERGTTRSCLPDISTWIISRVTSPNRRTQRWPNRGVIWGGWGAVAPPPPPKEKEKKKKERKKEKKEKKRKKEEKRKMGTINNVKILHIKCCFFFNFSIVRWHWKIKKFFGPPKKKLKWRPCGQINISCVCLCVLEQEQECSVLVEHALIVYDTCQSEFYIDSVFWAGASFQLFLGGKIFFIFQCHRIINKLEKQHFLCSNLTLFIVPFFLFSSFSSFFSFFSLFSFLFLFLFFLGGGDGPPPLSNDAPGSGGITYLGGWIWCIFLFVVFLVIFRGIWDSRGIPQEIDWINTGYVLKILKWQNGVNSD